MRGVARILTCAALWALAAGCGRERGSGDHPPARPLPVGGRLTRFRPPADGMLTEPQIDRYVRVRRASKGRSGREAAQAVGVDPEEFAWVRGRILEALVALDTRRVRSAAEETYARTLASLRETRKSARTPETARAIDEQVAGLERERASFGKLEPLPADVEVNARRIAARRAEVESVSP